MDSRRRGYRRLPAGFGLASSGRRGRLGVPAILGLALALGAAGALAAQARPKPVAPVAALELEVARVGRDGVLCMEREGRPLPAGTRVWLVQPDPPQSVAAATAGSGRCEMWPSTAQNTLVPLRVLRGVLDSARLAVAIVGVPRPPVRRRGVVTIDLDGDGAPERFRSCTSMEGVHLSIWTGRPGSGRLRWHRYYYLAYDVEPTCTDPLARDPAPRDALGRPDPGAG